MNAAMEIANAQVLEDGSVLVILTGDTSKLPDFEPSTAAVHNLVLRCGAQYWAVLSVSHPDPDGGLPIARVCLRGATHPRIGMVLRDQLDPLTAEEVDAFFEALMHFYKICRSVDGARLANLIQDWRQKFPADADDLSVTSFLRLATLNHLVNANLDAAPVMESLLKNWRVVATKIRFMVSPG